MSCGCGCSVAFPHGIMGWSAVCNCGFSDQSYLPFIFSEDKSS